MSSTILHSYELNQSSGNKDLDEVLDKVRRVTGEDWQVLRFRKIKRRLFRKPKSEPVYSLYLNVGGTYPYLQVGFYHPEADEHVEGWASAEVVINFLWGIVSGLNVLAST